MILQARRTLVASPIILFVSAVLVGSTQQETREKSAPAGKPDEKRPSFSLRASPSVAFSPAKFALVAELKGGANDYEEFYCASVEWDWGDGTKSESTTDCEPYEAGKSEIQRRFTTNRVYSAAGNYRVQISLKRKEKTLVAANTVLQVRPGIGSIY